MLFTRFVRLGSRSKQYNVLSMRTHVHLCVNCGHLAPTSKSPRPGLTTTIQVSTLVWPSLSCKYSCVCIHNNSAAFADSKHGLTAVFNFAQTIVLGHRTIASSAKVIAHRSTEQFTQTKTRELNRKNHTSLDYESLLLCKKNTKPTTMHYTHLCIRLPMVIWDRQPQMNSEHDDLCAVLIRHNNT